MTQAKEMMQSGQGRQQMADQFRGSSFSRLSTAALHQEDIGDTAYKQRRLLVSMSSSTSPARADQATLRRPTLPLSLPAKAHPLMPLAIRARKVSTAKRGSTVL